MKKNIIQKLCFGLLSALLCICLFFGLKVGATNYSFIISPDQPRGNAYMFLVGPTSYSGQYNINAVETTYSVMGNTQTPKQSIVIGSDDLIHFNFLNGDSDTLTYNQNYLYFYILDLSADKEYYGQAWDYDYTNDTPIYDLHTHTASYTQYNIITYELYSGTFVKYSYASTGANPNNMIYYAIYNEYMYGYAKNTALEYAYEQSQNAYTDGYYTGLEDGEEGKSPMTRLWEIIGGVFRAVANVMSIELFPSVPVGIFFLVPLVFGAVGFIFWIWKRGG